MRALVFIVSMALMAALTATANALMSGDRPSAPWVSFVLSELVPAITAYLILTLAMEGRVWPWEIKPGRVLGLFKGMFLGALLVAVCVGVLALLGSYSIIGFNWHYSPWNDLLTLGVTAGVAEEIMMRGTLFRLVEEGLGTWGGVAISACVFGGAHLTNPDGTLWGATSIAIEAGILFAAVYIITRSLWWCIGLHFAWNVAEGPVFGSIVSGSGAQDSWLVASWTGPELLTGGVFGLEASIVPVILLGALGVAALVYAWRKGLMISPIWIRKRTLTASSQTLVHENPEISPLTS